MKSARVLKFEKKLVRVIVPVLRGISPGLAARVLARLGRVQGALIPSARYRFDRAAQVFSHHLGDHWDCRKLARNLAANEPNWLARDQILDGLSEAQFEGMIDVRGRGYLDEALSRKKGVVLLACHYGSNLVPLHWLLRAGYPLRLYMERPNTVSRFLMERFRDDGPTGQSRLFISRRSTAAESAQSVLRALRVLKEGMILGLAGDVPWTGQNTAEARFLGQRIRLTATWVILAAKSQAPVLPVFCRTRADGTYTMAFQPTFSVPADTVTRGNVGDYVQRCMDLIEEQIREDPANANEYVNWLESGVLADAVKLTAGLERGAEPR